MIDTKLLMSNLDVVKKVIDFFAAKYANPPEWEKIKIDAIKNGKKFNSPNSEKFVNYGFLSPMDCNFTCLKMDLIIALEKLMRRSRLYMRNLLFTRLIRCYYLGLMMNVTNSMALMHIISTKRI